MDRGDADAVEHVREIKAEALGVPRQEMEAAAKRGAEAVKRAQAAGRLITEPSALNLSPSKKDQKGSVVAFYAAQSFEPAKELPRPRPPADQQRYYGLLSYTLIKVLRQQGTQLSYRELGHALVAEYQAERGWRGPTPYCEGDLDRSVLGLKTWPQRAHYFSQEEPANQCRRTLRPH
jgi:hypothetical protein